MKTPEEWLTDNVQRNDWNKFQESLSDSLWTNNVLEYMQEYAEYVRLRTIEEIWDIDRV